MTVWLKNCGLWVQSAAEKCYAKSSCCQWFCHGGSNLKIAAWCLRKAQKCNVTKGLACTAASNYKTIFTKVSARWRLVKGAPWRRISYKRSGKLKTEELATKSVCHLLRITFTVEELRGRCLKKTCSIGNQEVLDTVGANAITEQNSPENNPSEKNPEQRWRLVKASPWRRSSYKRSG